MSAAFGLEDSIYQENKNTDLVLLDNLCALSFFPLLKTCFNLRPAKIFYFQASKTGLKIACWLGKFGFVSRTPIKIDDVFMNDTQDSIVLINKFESLNICLEHQDKIDNLVNKNLSDYDSYFRSVCAVGIIKELDNWLETLLFQINRAKVLAREEEVSVENVILISPFSPLLGFLKVATELPKNIKICSQPFKMKTLPYLWIPVLLSLSKIILSLIHRWPILKKKEKSSNKILKPTIGITAAWDFKGFNKNKLDDFFWWRKSTLLSEQLVYIFEREDMQPTRDRLFDLKKMGIKSIALNPDYPGGMENVLPESQSHSLAESSRSFLFYFKLALRSLFGDSFSCAALSLIGWQIYKSEKLVPYYRNVNIKGLFHYNEAGLEHVNLAALQCNAARIGTHWSCLPAPNASTPKCHEVYFSWGEHDLKIAQDSGSISKNILISGCFLNELSHKEQHHSGQEAIRSMKNQGVRLTLTLLDNSPSVPNFYRFFIQWLVDDPSLGILIKSKGKNWKSVQEGAMGGLVQEAMDSGRLFVIDKGASPADAALLTDFSVGITSISAIAVAGLQGARVLFLDYEKMDQGKLKPYCIFHSLGPKRCVFYDPESLKEAVLGYFNDPESNPLLGDVSSILDQLDPFRDGKASQRIGEYVTWYIENLSKNLSKDEALRKATKKYAEKWGEDKVIRCNS
jgi:hypothetical protein